MWQVGWVERWVSLSSFQGWGWFDWCVWNQGCRWTHRWSECDEEMNKDQWWSSMILCMIKVSWKRVWLRLWMLWGFNYPLIWNSLEFCFSIIRILKLIISVRKPNEYFIFWCFQQKNSYFFFFLCLWNWLVLKLLLGLQVVHFMMEIWCWTRKGCVLFLKKRNQG